MSAHVGYDSFLSYINHQLQPAIRQLSVPGQSTMWRAVTLSRQSGCGAHALAEKLTGYLEFRSPKDAVPWTIFDQNLVKKVLEEHQLPDYLARFMPEDRILAVDDAINEILGLHPRSETLVEQTSETILRLAELGHVILVGRAANAITAKLPDVLHVRLVAPLEKRIQHMQEFEGLTRKAAMQRIQREDLGRKRYLKTYFGKDIDDPLLYHLIINTDLISLDEIARLIGEVVLNRVSTRIPVAAG